MESALYPIADHFLFYLIFFIWFVVLLIIIFYHTKYISGNKLKGLGGELMRQAAAQFISNCSEASLKISPAVVKTWKNVLDESLR